MSDVNNGVIDDDKQNEPSGPNTEDFVSRKVAEDFQRDMHKYKDKLKAADARANEAELKLKAIEEANMKDQQQWQELYEREKARAVQLEEDSERSKNLFSRAVKLQALKSELGDVKEVYLQHADVDRIEVKEDGTLSSESVKLVANTFRQQYPEVIPQASNLNITSQSPGNPNLNIDKSVDEMSFAEKVALLKKQRGE